MCTTHLSFTLNKPVFVFLFVILLCLSLVTCMKTTTFHYDKAILSKLQYDCSQLRQTIAREYFHSKTQSHQSLINNNLSSSSLLMESQNFAFAHARLLRLESRIVNLHTTLWYKSIVSNSTNLEVFKSSLQLKNKNNHSTSTQLIFSRDLLRHALYTDAGMLTIRQRKQINDRLYKILFLIAQRRFFLERWSKAIQASKTMSPLFKEKRNHYINHQLTILNDELLNPSSI